MKVKIKQFVSLILITIFSSVLISATPPPNWPTKELEQGPHLEHKPTTGLKMGPFQIHYEETTLAAVINAAGVGEISHQGDAGSSIYWVCYTLGNQNALERIWIIAHGEMGGHEHHITEIDAQAIKSIDGIKDCPSLPKVMQPLSFDRDIWLGTREENVFQSLGQPKYRNGPWQTFVYEGKVPGKCEPDGFDQINSFIFKVSDGKLIDIRTGQVTSC